MLKKATQEKIKNKTKNRNPTTKFNLQVLLSCIFIFILKNFVQTFASSH